jgi:superfamily II DNA or RNA helicase
MEFIPESPTVLRIKDLSQEDEKILAQQLTYIDKRVDFEIQKYRNNYWAQKQPDFEDKLDALKAQRQKSLLFRDDNGLWTYSGLQKRLCTNWGATVVGPDYLIPMPQLVAYEHTPPYKPYDYQEEMVSKLLERFHASVEAATGLGKSFCITLLAKRLGLKTLVMAPSISIAEQLYADFKNYFGLRKVGKFFGGKKESQKLFVIAVAASLTKVHPNDEYYSDLKNTQVFIADESHLCPAATLEKICTDLLANVPYRYFFSGTQLRNDGLDLLLEGIVGPRVFEMTVEQGVEAGYLARPSFRMVKIESDISYTSADANKMTRVHMYYNKKLNKIAGSLASSIASTGKQVLILIDELEQFTYLLPHFRHPVALAHGGVTKENASKIPPQYHESDPNALVKKFNEGQVPILVGTSCISTGTDVRNNQATIYLVGGKSEIAVRQGAIGRSTRIVPGIGKKSCMVFDFDVINIPVLHKHAKVRAKIYKHTYPDYVEVSGV